MSKALDVPALVKRVVGMENAPEFSAEYRRAIAKEFAKRGEPVTPVGVDRWRQRGSMPTARLLMLLRIARERKVAIDLLDYAVEGDRFVRYKAQDRVFKERRKREIARLQELAGERGEAGA